MTHSSRVRVRAAAVGAAIAAAALLAGCGLPLRKPTAAGGGETGLTLRNFQVDATGGHRAVLVRLSGVPAMVRHAASSNPARITIQAWGPAGAEDMAERTLPQADAAISLVRVSRQEGALRISLDLNGDVPPAYSVHQMADWIMIRLLKDGSRG